MLVQIDVDVDEVLDSLCEPERKELAEELFEEFGMLKEWEIPEDARQLVCLAQMECLNLKLPHYLRELLYRLTGAEFGA